MRHLQEGEKHSLYPQDALAKDHVGTDAVDVAEEPGELDAKGGPQVGVDGPGTVCDGHGLRDEAGASRHL